MQILLYGGQELLFGYGLFEDGGESLFQQLSLFGLLEMVGGKGDDGSGLYLALDDMLQDQGGGFWTAHDGHVDVHEDDRVFAAAGEFGSVEDAADRGLAVRGDIGDLVECLQEVLQNVQVHRIVVHDQQFGTAASRLCPLVWSCR